MKRYWQPVLAVSLLFLDPTVIRGESWGPFSGLIQDADYIAQHQRLTRNGKTIGTRLVTVYWKDKDFQEGLLGDLGEKPWTLSDYRRETDEVTTVFAFYGRGQHLWTVSPEKGVILYPGITTHRTPGEEIACSATEFDEILRKVSDFKKRAEGIKGKLDLPVFGRLHKAR